MLRILVTRVPIRCYYSSRNYSKNLCFNVLSTGILISIGVPFMVGAYQVYNRYFSKCSDPVCIEKNLIDIHARKSHIY